jgi:PhnB protein
MFIVERDRYLDPDRGASASHGGSSSLRWRHELASTKEDPVASRLNPYIGFADNARQAMEFYRDVFGGELAVNTFGEYGAAAPGEENKVMHAQLETPAGYTLMASDTPAGMTRTEGSTISMSLSGDDADELRGYFGKLSDGGSVTMPLEKQMWGDEFGMCVDRFGVQWMVNISQPAG